MPKLRSHFKKVNFRLDSVFTTFFFTLFTSCYEYETKTNENVINVIIRYFLRDSWKSIIIVILYILSLH